MSETNLFLKAGYNEEEFAEKGETTYFNGLHVVCISESCDQEADFEQFDELTQSHWATYWNHVVRLKTGEVVYAGHCPTHSNEAL